MDDHEGMVFIIAASLLWGVGDFFSKLAVTAVGPWSAVFMRSLFFFPIVMGYVLYKEDFTVSVDKDSIYPMLAGVFVALGIIFSRFSLSLYEVSLVKPIQRLSILITVILSIVFLNENMTRRKAVGVGFAVLAFFLLYPIDSELLQLSIGHIYLIALVFSLGLSTVFLRVGVLKKGVDQTRFFRALLQTVIVFSAVVIIFGLVNLADSISLQIVYPAINGIFGAAAFILFCKGLKTVGASTAKPMMVLATITTAGLGVVLLNESLFLLKVIGIFLAIISVLILSSESS